MTQKSISINYGMRSSVTILNRSLQSLILFFKISVFQFVGDMVLGNFIILFIRVSVYKTSMNKLIMKYILG